MEGIRRKFYEVSICKSTANSTSLATQQFYSFYIKGFLDGSVVKNPPANAGNVSFIPGPRRPVEGNGNHFGILAWEIPWTKEPGGYNPWGCKEWDTTEWLTHTQEEMGGVQIKRRLS